MRRAGFTMIELIFVIVILGILAAVALPKFAGVSDQANAQKCNAFVGTLNRTIGPSMWSESITAGNNGSVTTGINQTDYIEDADVPTTCGLTGTPLDVKLTGGSVTFGTSTYLINFTDGTISSSPKWIWKKTS